MVIALPISAMFVGLCASIQTAPYVSPKIFETKSYQTYVPSNGATGTLYQAHFGYVLLAIANRTVPTNFTNQSVPGMNHFRNTCLTLCLGFAWSDLENDYQIGLTPSASLFSMVGLALFALVFAWYINNICPGRFLVWLY